METLIEAFSLHLGEEFVRHAVVHYFLVSLAFVFTAMLVIIDLFTAISTARKLGERVRSHKLRRTIEKLSKYWAIQLLAAIGGTFCLFAPIYNLPYLSMLCFAGIMLVEGFSIHENIKRAKDPASKVVDKIEDIVGVIGSREEIEKIAREAIREAVKRKTLESKAVKEVTNG